MYFESLQAAVSMDGHGAFVWAAYAITAVVLTLMLSAAPHRERRLRRQLAGQFKRNQGVPVGVIKDGREHSGAAPGDSAIEDADASRS